MSDFWTYFGIFLGIFSLYIAYLSHSHVLKRIEQNPNSRTARISAAIFGNRHSSADYETRVTLKAILADKKYWHKLFASRGASVITEITVTLERYATNEDADIRLSEVVISKLQSRNIGFVDFISDILVELSLHFVFLSPRIEYRDAYFPLRNGLIVVVRKDATSFCCNDLIDLGVSKGHVDAWRIGLGIYYSALEMPIRNISDISKLDLLDEHVLFDCYEAIAKLVAAMGRYVEEFLADDDIPKWKKAEILINKRALNSAWSEMLNSFTWTAEHDKLRHFLVSSETIISASHKMLLGGLQVSQGQLVERYYFEFGRRLRLETNNIKKRLGSS